VALTDKPATVSSELSLIEHGAQLTQYCDQPVVQETDWIAI